MGAAANAQDDHYAGGITHEIAETDHYSIWMDGEGTVVDFTATIPGCIFVCWDFPGATLNFRPGARAGIIDASLGSYVNLYGGSVDYWVSVYAGAQVTVHGSRFEVVDWVNGTRSYDPGTILYVPYGTVTAYDMWGEQLFSGVISCADDATVLLGAEDPELNVEIDVKPGTDPSIINLRSNGLVPVAVLSDENFDATRVSPGTVQFAGASVALSGNGKYMAHAGDVDADGDKDMLFHFRTKDLKLEDGVTQAEVTLTGELGSLLAGPSARSLQSASQTDDATPIKGTDNVHILRPKKRK